MKIIKEGKNPNELPFTCKDCGCEFIADKREDLGYCEFHSSYFVTCPCCGKEFYIWDFEAKRLK
jgi:hypothetical protein